MKYADSIFRVLIGFVFMFVKVINQIHYQFIGAAEWVAKQDDNFYRTITREGVDYYVHEYSNMFYIIGALFIIWGAISLYKEVKK